MTAPLPQDASEPWLLELLAARQPAEQPAPAAGGGLRVPTAPEELGACYDLTLTHPEVKQVGFEAFDRLLGAAAAARGLACALIHQGTVAEATRRLRRGKLRIGFHLDYFALWHVADDPFARFSEAVQQAGGWPVNPPARSRLFTDKARAHRELENSGLGLPASVLLPASAAETPLTDAALQGLGLQGAHASLYLKRANGFGGRGVTRLENPTLESISAAVAGLRGQDRRDAVLLQRAVTCPRLCDVDGTERPAYFRVLYCLGEILPFWWNGNDVARGRPSYRALSETEIETHHLDPVLEYAEELAELTELDWFSTELCLSEGSEPSRHVVRGADGKSRPVVAIDYVNDQCDVDVQSRWLGAPPDQVVGHLAERFAEAAWRTRRLVFPLAERLRLLPAA